MKRKNFLSIVLCASLIMGLSILPTASTQAKTSKYINDDFIGSYTIEGKKPSFEEGWYTLTVDSIEKDGNVVFQVDMGGLNGSPIYTTNVIKSKIKGKKAGFDWVDTWENSGTGKLIFKKNGKLSLTLKITKESDVNRSTLKCKNLILEKYSDDHKLGEW